MRAKQNAGIMRPDAIRFHIQMCRSPCVLNNQILLSSLTADCGLPSIPWCKPSENSVENKDQEIRRWIWALVDTGSPKTHLSANCMLHIFPNFQPVFDRIAEGTLQIYPRFSFCGDQRRSRMSNNSIEHCRISWARIADRPDLEIINIVGFTTLRRCGFILTCDFESKTLTLQRENDQFWTVSRLMNSKLRNKPMNISNYELPLISRSAPKFVLIQTQSRFPPNCL